MDLIVHQLGELFLGAVPTVLIVLTFYLVFRFFFFAPLLHVMAERDARTIGAQKSAEEAQARAADQEKAYQEALKQARATVYAEQDAGRKRLLEERGLEVKRARAAAAAEVASAKERVSGELEAARKEIERSAPALAAEIARRMLEPRSPRSPGGAR